MWRESIWPAAASIWADRNKDYEAIFNDQLSIFNQLLNSQFFNSQCLNLPAGRQEFDHWVIENWALEIENLKSNSAKYIKQEFKYKNIHSCEAVVLACIDFRFWKETMKFVEEELGIKTYDFPQMPGAAKAINDCLSEVDIPMKCIGVPCNLHHVEKIVIVNHADCGAYGGSSQFKGDDAAEQKFHEGELKKAKVKIEAFFPGKEIILAYAKLADEGESVEFLRVD